MSATEPWAEPYMRGYEQFYAYVPLLRAAQARKAQALADLRDALDRLEIAEADIKRVGLP